MNDVAYDGISSDQGLSYISEFPKGTIYVGENFKAVLTLMNTSTLHTIDQLKVKVFL